LGLSSLRFDAAKITWKGQDGIPSFSEKALAAYLAESLARGSYQDALLRVRGAKEIWTDKLGFLSAPYFGGLNRKMKDFAAVDLVETKRLAQLLADKSPVALEKDGLLRYLINRSPNDLAQVALRYISVLVPAKLTIKQTVGLLGCAVDAKSLLKDEDNSLRDAAAAADRIVAAVHKSTSGYFLASEEDSSSDIRLSLLAGCILASYGEASSKPALIGVGQSLVESVLGLADAQGFVPARVLARGGAVELKTGILSPEEIYPLFADNPYYPHEVGFIRDAAPGIWAWTCAPSLSVKVSGNRYVFAARFPEGRSHFLSFYGVKPFANIQLYEIDYSPDNDFENYDASGYLYDRTIGALFLKMKHKKESEDIKLSF